MASTTPNKEIVRRICHLHGATECYLFVETGDDSVEVLANIPDGAIKSCSEELESWAGMKFCLSNFNINKEKLNELIVKSEKILPINI